MDDIDLKNKTITISDVERLEDLKEIKNSISPWIISNYEDLKSELQIYEEQENQKRIDNKKLQLMSRLFKLVSIDELEKIVQEHEQR